MQLFQRDVQYLGHIIGQHEVATDPAKVAAVESQSPRCTQKVKSFLGFVGYHQRFFSIVPRPLNVLSIKETKFYWGAEKECTC